ncbi:MAG: hypothetical protein GY875_14490 [Gammaproteobacteria bacterium]|nr:hypothetical protein [Gammaproteobacteria bacterium]
MSENRSRPAVAEAETLAAEKLWTKADVLLSTHATECAAGDAGLSCRPLLNYTRAYLLEQRARSTPKADKRPWLHKAVSVYRQVLEDVPAHAPTLSNLVAIASQLGDADLATASLEQAIEVNPGQRAAYAITLGDLLRDNKRLADALFRYEQAMAWDSTSPQPRQRIVELHRQLSSEQISVLAKRLDEWLADFPIVAAQGYRLVIDDALSDKNTNIAEIYLPAWVGALAMGGGLSTQRVEALYRQWKFEPLAELRKYFDDATRHPDWWCDYNKPERGQGLTLATLAIGHQEIERGDVALVKPRWNLALQDFVPQGEQYFSKLRGQPHARLELQTALALLYYQYPDIASDQEFRDLIGSIFNDKRVAYEANDLSGIQRHHTVLGRIYTRQPQLESDKHRAYNAVFQLHYAIHASNRRRQSGDVYQPLPRLREMLAKTCAQPSKVAKAEAGKYCRYPNHTNAVPGLYLNAAEAYLDTDELTKALEMLEQADGRSQNTNERAISAALRQIYSARVKLPSMAATSVDTPAWLEHSSYQWIKQETFPMLELEFVQRQRFKILTDYMSLILPNADMTPSAKPRLQDTLRLLDVAAKRLEIANTNDVLRTEVLAQVGIRYTSAQNCPGPEHEDLRWVQAGLKSLSVPFLVVDGQYDAKTRAAIGTFQAEHGLGVDGTAGSRTKAKLRQILCE